MVLLNCADIREMFSETLCCNAHKNECAIHKKETLGLPVNSLRLSSLVNCPSQTPKVDLKKSSSANSCYYQ